MDVNVYINNNIKYKLYYLNVNVYFGISVYYVVIISICVSTVHIQILSFSLFNNIK